MKRLYFAYGLNFSDEDFAAWCERRGVQNPSAFKNYENHKTGEEYTIHMPRPPIE